MIRNPILRVLSSIQKHRVRALLMGGQACVFYGAAEFSREFVNPPAFGYSERRDHKRSAPAMKQLFTASVWQEGEWFVAQCMQVDVASQGSTDDEALDNLRDALELHFTPPVATVIPSVRNIEVDIHAA